MLSPRESLAWLAPLKVKFLLADQSSLNYFITIEFTHLSLYVCEFGPPTLVWTSLESLFRWNSCTHTIVPHVTSTSSKAGLQALQICSEFCTSFKMEMQLFVGGIHLIELVLVQVEHGLELNIEEIVDLKCCMAFGTCICLLSSCKIICKSKF